MKRHLFACLLAVLVSLPAGGTATRAATVYSLDQCLQMARERNPAVLAGAERAKEAEWKKKSAYDNFLPRLGMDYSYTYLDDAYSIDKGTYGLNRDIDVKVHNNYGMALYVDQPLFTGFRLMETYHLADLGLKTAKAGEELARLDVSYRTVRAYYTLLLALKRQEVMDTAVAKYESHYRDSQQYYQNEIIPKNDLLEAEVYLANARQDAALAAGDVRRARIALATLIKEPLTAVFEIRDQPLTSAVGTGLEALQRMALEMRPELKQANYKVESSRREITIAKSTYFPDIVLRAEHDRYGGDAAVNGHGWNDLQDPEVSKIGVYANWNLFSWGQTGHEVRAATAASRAARQNLEQVMDAIRREVEDNYIGAVTAYGNIIPARKAVEQARESLRMNELRYRNQIATSTDVLDAQTLLTDTETKLYQAVYQYNIWLAGLARAVGAETWSAVAAK